jgi:MtN3 and saliva related transmembrane protein
MLMVEDFVVLADTIGIIAGILVLSSFIPQLHKAYKTKTMLDVSIYLMGLLASGLFLWVIYGIIREDPVIIGTNVSGLILNVILLILKLKYDKLHK